MLLTETRKYYYQDKDTQQQWEQKRKDELKITDAEWIFRIAVFEYVHGKKYPHLPNNDWLTRPLIFTPFNGNYGQAGIVITINGSPPKFLAMIECEPTTNLNSIVLHVHNRYGKFDTFRGYSISYLRGVKAELVTAILALLCDRGLWKK